jgi:acetyl-CoA carboxylase carboxyltransferase component
VNVVIGDMIGNAYLIMNSKASGADIVYALDGVKIGLMDGSAARKILSDGGEEAARKFEEKQTVRQAAKRGYVDEIVAARSLRKKVLIAMEILSAKRGEPIAKKHAGK